MTYTRHFVTLFDTSYLPQGLALHASLTKHLSGSLLWIVCVDEATFQILQKIDLKDARLIKLAEVETADLIKVKPGRSIGEYCWTLTPFVFDFVFDLDSTIDCVTYLDADVFVLNSQIEKIFEEFEATGKSVLITKHAYSPEYDQSAIAGIYCVQLVTFKKKKSSSVRKEWQHQCLDWCYARYEDGKFGDQKYLDVWPEKHKSEVHVLAQESLMLGPWNCTRYPYSDGAVWHFHGLSLIKNPETKQINVQMNGMYKIPETTIKHVYGEYLTELTKQIAALASVGWNMQEK